MVHGATLSIVYRVTCLIYGFGLDHGVGLDYKEFSSMPYGVTYPNIVYGFDSKHEVAYPNIVYRFDSKYRVTHSNMVYRFGLDYEDFSSILYTLVYGALPRDLVRVPPLGHTILSSYPPALKYLLVR